MGSGGDFLTGLHRDLGCCISTEAVGWAKECAGVLTVLMESSGEDNSVPVRLDNVTDWVRWVSVRLCRLSASESVVETTCMLLHSWRRILW